MENTTITPANSQLSKLVAFRQALYRGLTRARDALFELLDAVLTTPQLTSFPALSCAPVFHRQWPSLYEALQDGQLDRPALLELTVTHLPVVERPLLVGDHTAWARTLRERTFEHQPTPLKGQKPITIGHGYSTLRLRAGADRQLVSALAPHPHRAARDARRPDGGATPGSLSPLIRPSFGGLGQRVWQRHVSAADGGHPV
jgi:hypothetical protein